MDKKRDCHVAQNAPRNDKEWIPAFARMTGNMENLITAEVERDSEEEIQTIDFNWIENPSVQKLLDVVVSIIAEEYIQIVRQNPDVFQNKGGIEK